MPDRPALPAPLAESRLIAIVRGRAAAHVPAVVLCLADAGVRCVEVTLNTPSALETLRRASRSRPDVLWGAGTVLDAEAVHASADAGARFVVAPNLDESVGRACAERGIDWFPGAATATEIHRAWQLGATAVKVFPARSLGGPAFLREVAAPLDHVRLIPTGGVALSDVQDYLAGSAVAVGLGGTLLGDALDTGDVVALGKRATAAVEQCQPERLHAPITGP